MRNALLLVLVGCTSPQPPYDLTYDGASSYAGGYDLHTHLARADGSVLITNEWAPFERPVTYGDILDPNVTYTLLLFLDRNADSNCTSADSAWQITITPASDDVTVDLDRITPIPAACDFFALHP